MNKRYALCVGNNYPGTTAALQGCVNDALDWSVLLMAEGYEAVAITEASRHEVVERLRNLVSLAGFGDRIVFTFSGHGTWVPDRDADEADGRDEAMVMAGLSHDDLLLDDDLQVIFDDLKYGSSALILSDSCHSGTVSRFTDLNPPATPGRRKFISPVDLDMNIGLERALELEAVRASAPPRRTANLISGCDDQEYSYDAAFNGRPNGAFTRTAIDHFRRGISLNSWHKAIRTNLPHPWYPQSPQLTATAYRKYTRAL